jgi:hypothetical protein
MDFSGWGLAPDDAPIRLAEQRDARAPSLEIGSLGSRRL